MRKLLVITALTLCTTPVFAADKNVIFSCTSTEGKPLTVKRVGNDYEYSYDKTTFKNPIKKAVTNDSSIIARGSGFTTYALELENDGLKYLVGFVQPNGNAKEFIEPGATISQSKEQPSIGSVDCDTRKKSHYKFDVHLMNTL
ncbi:TPA: hypothetical protein PXD89_002056 [Mannheimia haemolytica]|nr:hypothetical protein [Mannheimia haemolytica]HDL5515362.1 hypothetical protein [Mannheimia haemolytica]HDL5813490.1 hypothetical protein [Mannheimia haemolytica]HDZ3515138.1 hypothetical protein [Mannheimia haemolytica]HEB5625686.1 hypothetical protein [Mannheimia haemolytica]